MRRTNFAEIRTLEHFFGQKSLTLPTAWWLQLCTSEPSDSANGSVPSGTLGDRRRISNLNSMFMTVDDYRTNRYAISSAASSSDITGVGWVELWSASSGGDRWFWGFISDGLDAPLSVNVLTGERVIFRRGTFRIKEE